MTDNKQQQIIEQERIVGSEKNPQGCTIPLNGCLTFILLSALCGIGIKECKRADIRLEEEKIKLEQLRDGTHVDDSNIIQPDTLKIWKYQKTCIPLLREYQNHK